MEGVDGAQDLEGQAVVAEHDVGQRLHRRVFLAQGVDDFVQLGRQRGKIASLLQSLEVRRNRFVAHACLAHALSLPFLFARVHSMDAVGLERDRRDPAVPGHVQTARLVLRPWRADDAEALLVILEANRAHLGPWIPARVAEPAPLAALTTRLEDFAQAFAADREWRYALHAAADGELLGEASLFPRSPEGRVPFPAADRAEIGYWLRADRTGAGLATEAASALCDVAGRLASVSLIEIRCDARNHASAAVPKRLGFSLSATEPSMPVAGDAAAPSRVQVWTRATRAAV